MWDLTSMFVVPKGIFRTRWRAQRLIPILHWCYWDQVRTWWRAPYGPLLRVPTLSPYAKCTRSQDLYYWLLLFMDPTYTILLSLYDTHAWGCHFFWVAFAIYQRFDVFYWIWLLIQGYWCLFSFFDVSPFGVVGRLGTTRGWYGGSYVRGWGRESERGYVLRGGSVYDEEDPIIEPEIMEENSS